MVAPSLKRLILLFCVVLIFVFLKNENLTNTIKTFPNKNEDKSTNPSDQIEPGKSAPIKEDSSTNTSPHASATSSQAINPPQKSSSSYIAITEGKSDTDESYVPEISPCVTPMGYRLGSFDSNFKISKENFLNEIKRSSDLWEEAYGKKLFYYDEKGPLTINLIYDERQARTEDLSYLIIDIENAKQGAEDLQKKYNEEKKVYLEQEESLKRDSDNFTSRSKLYSEKVERYNTEGGAPQAEYDSLTKELDALKKEASALDVRKDSLHRQMESINKKVAHYNEFVTYINSLIKKSNSLGAKKFTEGRFSPSSQSIDIYQYSDLAKLQRVITHELGHAIGINHTKNINSVMYAVNTSSSTSLTKEDISSLLEVCKKQSN